MYPGEILMGVFKSEKCIPFRSGDLKPAAEDLMSHFRDQGFDVAGEETITGGWDISLHKGGLFKAVLGMKTALKVSIEPTENGTVVKAGIGIFGQQVIPTLIMWYVFWPVLLTQLWGLVRQSNLDDEAIQIVEHSLSTYNPSEPETNHRSSAVSSAREQQFCTQCGAARPANAKFCPECGKPQ
jgi:hypothetical protein